MLDQDADETLVGAEDRAVEHHRAVALAILADIARVEAFGHHAVGLDRPALPRPADRVGQVEFELGGVESALARQFFPAIILVRHARARRSEEHTSELQPLMRISYAVFCLKKKT